MSTAKPVRPSMPTGPSGGSEAPSWRDRFAAAMDRWMTQPQTYRRALSNPMARWLMRRRAERLFGHMAGFVHSQVLLACVRLQLFETLLARPRNLEELAQLTRLAPTGLQRLLDSAQKLGLLEQRSGGRYGLGPLGTPVAAHAGLRDMIEHNAVLYQDLSDPLRLLRQPDGAAMHAYWPYASEQAVPTPPDQFARYSALMASSQRFVIEELLQSYPFQQHQRVLDVGGGQGGWISALAEQQPDLQLALFDLPPVAEIARQRLQAHGLGTRVQVHGGSFFDDALPSGADLVTLLRVAHDHDDAAVLCILRNIHQALATGGTLLLAEPMATEATQPSVSDPYFHFYLLAMGSGRLRSQSALSALMLSAGFTHIESVPNPMPLHASLLIGRKNKG